MNNYILVNLFIIVITIVLLLLIAFKIRGLINIRNNNLNKIEIDEYKSINELTDDLHILQEKTTGIGNDETTDSNDLNLNAYFEITHSTVVTHSNFII